MVYEEKQANFYRIDILSYNAYDKL